MVSREFFKQRDDEKSCLISVREKVAIIRKK